MPESFAESSNGLLLIANGIDQVLRWNGSGDMGPAGLAGPTVAPVLSLTGAGTITGTYFAYVRFVDDEGNVSNLSPISNSVTGTNNLTFTYTAVPVSQSPRVVRRQILRNTAGQTTTFYVDIDTQDLSSTGFQSVATDTVLQTGEAVPLLDTDGSPLANRYDPPPSDRAFLAQHLDRMFAAGVQPYSEGSAKVTFGSATVIGIGTNWKSTFAGRLLYVSGSPKPYQISSASDQTITISEVYTGPTNPYAEYSVEPAPATRNLLYYSESGLPEAWPPVNAIEITEDGDEITGLMPMASFLYVLKRKRVYRFTAQADPADDGFVFLASRRGCVNNRCWAVVGSEAYMLDESGIYRFSGGESEELSKPIDGIFSGDDQNYKINWAVSRFFHCCHDETMSIIRFFVTMSGDYLPRHALCLDYRSGTWWVERFPRPIGASHLGRTGRFTETWRTKSGEQLYFGSTGRTVLASDTCVLDGVSPEKGNTRLGVASSTNFGVTIDRDLPPSIVGLTITIARGRGKNQTRTIESVSGRTITISRPWSAKPDSTSVIQLAGISYQYRSGKFQYANQETRNPRSVRIFHKPSSVAGDRCDLRLFPDWDDRPQNWYTDMTERESYGITYTKDQPDAEIDLTKSTGKTSLRSDGHRESNIDSPTFLTFELKGVSSESPLSIRQIILEGVAGGAPEEE